MIRLIISMNALARFRRGETSLRRATIMMMPRIKARTLETAEK
jgi:hypothetical protein